MTRANKRASGKGEIPSLFHTERARLALPERECSAELHCVNIWRYGPSKYERGFALIELPLLLAFLALAGIVTGALLWRHSGHVTIGSWIAFCFVLPLIIFVAAVFRATLRDNKRNRRTKQMHRTPR